MIVTRTPLRISFVGGGSDRASFYQEEPGACVAAAIDKYVYVAVNDKYDGAIRAAYSVTENVAEVNELRHDLIRSALKLTGRTRGIEVHSIADIPAGTGLGSSSAFTVGLLRALGLYHFPSQLADDACFVEIGMCEHPIGKQDQYTAAHGGVNLLTFSPAAGGWNAGRGLEGTVQSGRVTVQPIACDLDALSSHCLLLDTGLARQGDAGQVLASQQQARDDVRELAEMARLFARRLAIGNLEGCGAIMDAAWQIKQRFCSTPHIDYLYAAARDWGAWGGKLCGAGGGGFLLFLAPPARHAAIVQALGLRHVPIQLGVAGCQVVYS